MTERRKRGRPRKLTPELETALFRGISQGKTIKDACKAAGISFQTVTQKRDEDQAFRDCLARAYLHGSVFSLDDAEHRLRHSSAQRIMVDREVALHARWRASRLLPQFSDKLKVTPDVPPVLGNDDNVSLIEAARAVGALLALGGQCEAKAALPAPIEGNAVLLTDGTSSTAAVNQLPAAIPDNGAGNPAGVIEVNGVGALPEEQGNAKTDQAASERRTGDGDEVDHAGWLSRAAEAREQHPRQDFPRVVHPGRRPLSSKR